MKHLVALIIALINSAFALEKDFFESVVIPSTMEVPVDGSIYIKIKNPIKSQTACDYKPPGKKEINSDPSVVVFDKDKCAIRIERVQITHAGAWQLISTFKNTTFETSIKGLSTVIVRESAAIVKPDQQVFSYTDNFAPMGAELSYCFVTRSLGDLKMSDIDMTKCMIPKDVPSYFQDGEWSVRMGIMGQPREISYSVNIQSSDETIETDVKRIDNENIQLLCRVKNQKNILMFCRFERIDGFGLNIEDGMSSDIYRYHGQGFDHGECGLEVLKMTGNDKAQWKCFLGLMDFDDASKNIPEADKRIYKHSVVLDASDNWNKLRILNDEAELFFVDSKSAIIQCNSNNPFDYCWFLHPIHKILSVSDKKTVSDDDDFQYYGDGFHLGQCGVKIRSFHFSDAGEWKCGLGRASESMKEAVKTMKVEVKASSMMAITKQIEDFTRNTIVIQCRAIPIGSSLVTCHFLMPNGEAFSINEQVTQSDAIDGLYYFDPNRKLADGYCTVVVKSLNKDIHAGKWTCSGRILGHHEESYETVYVTVDGIRGASISFLSIVITAPILLFLVMSALGVGMWKRRQQVRNEILDEISMHTISSTGTDATTGSDESRAVSGYSA